MKKLILALFILLYCLPSEARWDERRADNQIVNTANFTTNLSSVDNTVQKALETLDTVAGGGSGDSVTVNGSAVDTTANFKDGTDVTWAIADGGAGGPDDVTGTVVDDSHAHVITNIDAFTKANLATQTSDVTEYAEADGETFTGTNDFSGATMVYPAGSIDNDDLAATGKTVQISYVIDGGGSAITTGAKHAIPIGFPFEITSVDLVTDQSGDIIVGIWKDTYANYPPTAADYITAAATPTVIAGTKSTDSTLTGWTKQINKGDVIKFNVESAVTVEWATLTINGVKS